MLTPLAAIGLGIVMALAAIVVHIPAGEWSGVATNVVLGALAGVVAWGRIVRAPIAPRGSNR